VTVLNCIGWMIYGCQKRDWYLFWANLPGLLLGLYYSVTCLTLLAKQKA
jgi:solute carrier family 50 protein (sugar transporter)